MSLRFYSQASTANPTGRRPWNSRLSFYIPNSFNPPTAGQGPFLLQPGVMGAPQQNGGLGCDSCSGMAGVSFPNYATFQRPRQSRRRFDSVAPMPVYSPVSAVTSQLSGLGQNETQILGLTVDPTLLAIGVGVAFLAVYLLGSGRPRRRAHRLRKKISKAQTKLRAIEAV